MENRELVMVIYYLDHNNKNQTKKITSINASGQVEAILTRGLQFLSDDMQKTVIIPPHRITKITY